MLYLFICSFCFPPSSHFFYHSLPPLIQKVHEFFDKFNLHTNAHMCHSVMRCIPCFLLIIECCLYCLVQTGLERVVRMALTIGLYVWVFQSQASLDKKVNKDYLNIRR